MLECAEVGRTLLKMDISGIRSVTSASIVEIQFISSKVKILC